MTLPSSAGAGAERHSVVRVLLASPLPPPLGGMGTWTRLLLSASPPTGIERSHVNTSPGRVYHYTRGVSAGRLVRQVPVFSRVMGRIASTRPHVFHLTSSYDRAWARDAAFLAAARLCGAKTILNLHGGDFERFYNHGNAKRRQSIMRTLRRCSLIVPITAQTAGFLVSLQLTNVRTIPNCIDIRPRRDREWQSPLERWLYVGWIMRSKGLLELLAALRATPHARLTLVGPPVPEHGSDSAEILASAAREPALRGRLAHVPALTAEEVRAVFDEHDLFVFPSHREGLPYAVLEAMEAGIPVVASDVGAIPEMIRDGTDGVIIPARDADALTAAVRRVVENPALATSLARSARHRVAARYSLESVWSTWTDVYRSLADNGRAPHRMVS